MTHLVTATVLSRETGQTIAIRYTYIGGAFGAFEMLQRNIERALTVKFDDALLEVTSVSMIRIDHVENVS